MVVKKDQLVPTRFASPVRMLALSPDRDLRLVRCREGFRLGYRTRMPVEGMPTVYGGLLVLAVGCLPLDASPLLPV